MDRPIRDEESAERQKETSDDWPQTRRGGRKKETRQEDDFNPTSSGEERGEMM